MTTIYDILGPKFQTWQNHTIPNRGELEKHAQEIAGPVGHWITATVIKYAGTPLATPDAYVYAGWAQSTQGPFISTAVEKRQWEIAPRRAALWFFAERVVIQIGVGCLYTGPHNDTFAGQTRVLSIPYADPELDDKIAEVVQSVRI